MPTPEKINKSPRLRPKVLVAPLDWGLGHATRCIPIIKELQNQRCEIVIAASGSQKALLQAEFPSLIFKEMPGYDIKLDKNRAFTVLRLLLSIPKILIRIKREKAWLRGFSDRENPDLVISDNRYGLRLPGIYCVIITHQLLIKTPFGALADRLLQQINYRFIRRFSQCWVPDIRGGEALAGELSNPEQMPPITTRFIGWLSRFEAPQEGEPGAGGGLLVLLSGPEPQRSLLEEKILAEATAWKEPMTLVRGLPGGGQPLDAPAGVVVYDHLPTLQLEGLIRTADLILARSGYSTVMDLIRLRKRAILVPTPGQTEQEYLADYLTVQGWACCVRQERFSLPSALEAARTFPYRSVPEPEKGILTGALCEVLDLVTV